MLQEIETEYSYLVNLLFSRNFHSANIMKYCISYFIKSYTPLEQKVNIEINIDPHPVVKEANQDDDFLGVVAQEATLNPFSLDRFGRPIALLCL